jgi:hypothetical protein
LAERSNLDSRTEQTQLNISFISQIMTNIYFNSRSILKNTQFTFSLDIDLACSSFVDFVVSNVLIFRRGTVPKQELYHALQYLCWCRLNPQEIGEIMFAQQISNQIGVPAWFSHLLHLLPTGQISVKGIFSIKLSCASYDFSKVQQLRDEFQHNLLQIRRWLLDNGVQVGSFTIGSEPSRKTEITVFSDPTNHYEKKDPQLHSDDLNCGQISFHFPSSNGYQHNLSWLFCLLFLPRLISKTDDEYISDLSDFTRFSGCIFFAMLSDSLVAQLRYNILVWYFDGNLVTFKNPNFETNPPRNPITGRSSNETKSSKAKLISSEVLSDIPQLSQNRPVPDKIKTDNLMLLVKQYVREVLADEVKNMKESLVPSFI